MSTQSSLPAFSEAHVPVVPSLESGDHLSRAEFERRYEAMPELKKAELIDGVVYVGSPVSSNHAEAHARVMLWLGTYAARTSGIICGDNATVVLDDSNEPQPDALLRVAKQGQTIGRGDKQYLFGAPELVAEIALTSASRDLHSKLDVYRRHKVREYLVWRVLEGEFDWFQLVNDEYQRVVPGADGVFRSQAFPGLWLDRASLLGGNMQSVLTVLDRGLASPEHTAFLEQLARPS